MQRDFGMKKLSNGASGFSSRLISAASAEQEWLYLVNETLEGEKCIVPLLGKMLKHPVVVGNKPLSDGISKQHNEEVQHVRLFNSLAGQERIEGSGYRRELNKYVENIPTVTLKLFALQGMLEGFALGALRYRLRYVEKSRSEKTDARALAEELDHVQLSFDHFKYLQAEEGVCTKSEFFQVSRDVNRILANSFSGANISRIFQMSFGLYIGDSPQIEGLQAMRTFKSISAQSVIENRNRFIDHYLRVANA